MIAILKSAGRYVPVVVCDQCGRPIDDALAAVAVSTHAPEGSTAQAFHAHKGACDAALTERLGGLAGSEELSVHLIDLVRGAFRPDHLNVAEQLLRQQDGS
jgi:hypothetical protein